MSTRRYSLKPKLIRGPGGSWLCRQGCGQECQPPRRTFCSADCVHHYLLRRSGSYLRKCVKARDKGICLHCGLDCIKLRREFRKARKLQDSPTITKLKQRYPRLKFNRSYWAAHHLTAVAMGGGEETDLSKIATLCEECHLIETNKLRKELRAKKKIE